MSEYWPDTQTIILLPDPNPTEEEGLRPPGVQLGQHKGDKHKIMLSRVTQVGHPKPLAPDTFQLRIVVFDTLVF